MVDPILFKHFLRKKGDEQHCLYLTCKKLIIQFKGRQQIFDLHEIKNIRVAPKKLIVMLVAGGIGTSFSMLAYSLGWYHYYLNLFSILGFFTLMYAGWVGKEAMEIHEGKYAHIYLLWKNVDAVKQAVNFIQQYRLTRSSNPKLIFHVAQQSSWAMQIHSEEYLHDSLDTEGFIHTSLKDELLETFSRYFSGSGKYVLLIIDENHLKSEVKHEYVASRKAYFPHIFGPINKTAIRRMVEFESTENLQYLVQETIPD